MKVRLISLPSVRLARLVGLVRRIEPVELQDSKEWGLLIRGRGSRTATSCSANSNMYEPRNARSTFSNL